MYIYIHSYIFIYIHIYIHTYITVKKESKKRDSQISALKLQCDAKVLSPDSPAGVWGLGWERPTSGEW